jgi:CRP-like cAMP-binding protein
VPTHSNDPGYDAVALARRQEQGGRSERLRFAEPFSLRDLPFFASVDENTISALAADAKVETAHGGVAIFRQGDPVSAVVFVLRGFVKVMRIAADGDETLIAIRCEGESVIEPLAVPGEPCGVSAETVGVTTLLRIPAARFVRLAKETSALGAAIADDARARIAALVGEIEALKSLNADQRLAHFILSLCPPGEESHRFRLPYDKRLIAAKLGVKQETLSRAFAKLRDYGVRTETREIFVESVSRLAGQCDHPGREARGGALSRDNAA